MKTILVPTDFSEIASNAVEYAANICFATESSLLILYVEKETDELAAAKLELVCKTLRESFPTVSCNFMLTKGSDIAVEIAGTATRMKADLIIMGTQGITNFEKIIFGSNTAAVIEKANCTVLSIPYLAKFRPIKRIVFATNFEHEDIRTAVTITQLAKAFSATLIVAHVLEQPGNEEDATQKIELFCREVAKLSDYSKIRSRVEVENTVTMGLDSIIEHTHADVLALSTHKRTFLEKIVHPSITQKFAEHSEIPLIAFHASPSR